LGLDPWQDDWALWMLATLMLVLAIAGAWIIRRA